MLDIAARKQRWMDLLNMNSPVNRVLVVDCAEGMPQRPMLWWEKEAERMEWSYLRYQRMLENLDLIDDHAIPHLNMITGTEIFAEAFGCKVHKPSDNTPFALPMVHTVEEAEQVCVPRLEDTKLMRLFEMGAKLRQRAGQDVLLSLPDIQTPCGIAALIWEKSEFFIAMMEEPEAVLALSAKVRELLFAFLDLWKKTFGPETIAHYPDYYMPEGITLSEDEIGAISPALFEAFFADDLRLIAERYGAIGIHCCAHSKHQWTNFAKVPNLRMINLHLPIHEKHESMEVFRDLCAQMPWEGEYDPLDIPNAERMHVAKFPYAPTMEDAHRLTERFHAQYPGA